jgi:nicotinamidase-related amidase
VCLLDVVDDVSTPGHPNDIEGKRGLDTFASTNLGFILRSRGMKTLAVAGFLTNCCVESTIRTGYEKDFSVVGCLTALRRCPKRSNTSRLKRTSPCLPES